MIKNQTIGIVVEGSPDSVTQTEAENLQYTLLGRGYKWSGGNSYLSLNSRAKWILYVDIKDKRLAWNPLDAPDFHKPKDNAYHIIRLWNLGFAGTIKVILYPPTPPPDFKTIQGCTSDQMVRVYDNGNVEFGDGDNYVLTNDTTITAIAKELGITTSGRLPIAAFEYPSSSALHTAYTRIVRVTLMDNEYIKGYEIEDANDKSDGTPKTFRLDKVTDGVRFVKFVR